MDGQTAELECSSGHVFLNAVERIDLNFAAGRIVVPNVENENGFCHSVERFCNLVCRGVLRKPLPTRTLIPSSSVVPSIEPTIESFSDHSST